MLRDDTERGRERQRQYNSRVISPLPLTSLIPPPLADARLEVRGGGDVLARVLHDGLDFDAVGVESFLQKHSLIRKHPALMPRHAIPQIIQLDLLRARAGPHARDVDFALAAIRERHADGRAALAPSPSAAAATGLDLIAVIVVVALEESAAPRRRRRALHLQREPAARVDGIALAEGVRDFFDVDGVESYADPDSAALAWIVYENEFALLALRDVAKEGVTFLLVELGFGI